MNVVLFIIFIYNKNKFLNSPEKKCDEETAENSEEAIEGDVEGNVQVKMVVSNGKVWG